MCCLKGIIFSVDVFWNGNLINAESVIDGKSIWTRLGFHDGPFLVLSKFGTLTRTTNPRENKV